MAEKQFVPREVIADTLLVALDDKNKVAIVASESDLQHLIAALEYAPEDRDGERLRLLKDLRMLCEYLVTD